MRWKIQPKPRAALERLSKPVDLGGPEALAWQLFDVQTYISGTTTTLTFFTATRDDKTLGNMEGPGQLPEPQYFEIYGWNFDLLTPVQNTAEGITGSINDLSLLLRGGRGTWEFSYNQKSYGIFPLESFHGTGGPTGFGWGLDNTAAGGTPSQTMYANNGIFDGGFWVGGSIVIAPKQAFSVRLSWSAAQTLANGNTSVKCSMFGTLHRKVL